MTACATCGSSTRNPHCPSCGLPAPRPTALTYDASPQQAAVPSSPWASAGMPQQRGASGPPTQPAVLELAGVESLADEFVWRRHMARHAASQTLSLQRTEHYVRQVRTYVAVWFWLGIVSLVVAVIAMIVAAASASSPY